MSPEEICKLKWKNIEIVDLERVSNKKAQEEWEQVMGEAQDDGIELEIERRLNLKIPLNGLQKVLNGIEKKDLCLHNNHESEDSVL